MKNKFIIYLVLVFGLLLSQSNGAFAMGQNGSGNGIHDPGTGVANPELKEANQGTGQGLTTQNEVQTQTTAVQQSSSTTAPASAAVQTKERARLQNGSGTGTPEQKQLHVNPLKDNTGAEQSATVRSQVANAVQALLQIADRDKTIGEQIRVIAQAQNQNHEKLESGLQKINSRSKVKKVFIGPDYKEINSAKGLLQQNQEQIQQLNQIQNQNTNLDNLQNLKEQINILEQANLELENQVKSSENGFSLLGWMFKWFAK